MFRFNLEVYLVEKQSVFVDKIYILYQRFILELSLLYIGDNKMDKNYIICGICKRKHNVGSQSFKRCQHKVKRVILKRLVIGKSKLLEQLRITNFHLCELR